MVECFPNTTACGCQETLNHLNTIKIKHKMVTMYIKWSSHVLSNMSVKFDDFSRIFRTSFGMLIMEGN